MASLVVPLLIPTAASFEAYWNVRGCPDLPSAKWGLHSGNETLLVGRAPATKSLGGLPFLSENGTAFNGGVPEAMNATLHLALLTAQIEATVPADFAGLAVLDWEVWVPNWDAMVWGDKGCTYHGDVYRNLSRAIVRSAHPTWDQAQVEARAKADFEAAALQALVATVRRASELRGAARWGFYAFPQNYFVCSPTGTLNPPADAPDAPASYQCGYENPLVGASLRAHSDALAPLWEASTALFPSVYLPSADTSPAQNAAYARAVAAESLRVARQAAARRGATRPAVLVYTNLFYHHQPRLLTAQDLTAVYNSTAAAGADGAVVWGGTKSCMDWYVDGRLGPAIQAARQQH